MLNSWTDDVSAFDPPAFAEYRRCISNPETIWAMCDDFRASATIDLVHDEEDADRPIERPFLVLWGERGPMSRSYDILDTWRGKAINLRGKGLACGTSCLRKRHEPQPMHFSGSS